MRLIKLKTVIEKTGMAKSTIYRNIQAGAFPKPIKQSIRSVAWVESEIDEWIMERMEQRSA